MRTREIYTYTDLTALSRSKSFAEIRNYPQIAVSSDLRKGLKGRLEIDRVKGIFAEDSDVIVTDFHSFSTAIDKEWGTNQNKFNELIILSEYIRKRINQAGEDTKARNYLTGCLRNLSNIHSAILLLEQAHVSPDDLKPEGNRDLELFAGAWKNLRDRDPVIGGFQSRMKEMENRSAWRTVFNEVFHMADISSVRKLVFHGFYYITPYQEYIMQLLEKAGFQLIFLFPYDARFPFVYEIWDKTYTEENGYPPKALWHMERAETPDPYGNIFEGKPAKLNNKPEIREYASVMEFVDDVKNIRKNGYTLYSSNYKTANQILKDYFPEEYGERKLLSYPIGQFISTLNEMWDEEKQTITLEEDRLIECFSSGWLAHEGISGKEYMQDLMHVLPFFNGCHTIEEWEKRIRLLREIKDTAVKPFEKETSLEESCARWQEAAGNPFVNFSALAVPEEKLEVILTLIRRLLYMAKELFQGDETVSIQDHIRKLDRILKTHEMSNELYEEERDLVKEIFEELGKTGEFQANCYPADISNALSLFMCGRFEDGEIQTKNIGLVVPMYFVDAACIKNNSKVHICLCDVNSMPGEKKPFTWPLTRKIVKECKERTGNRLLENLLEIMESSALCNRYFMYSALKNKEVQISWVSTMDEKILAPSSYIKLVCEAAGVTVRPSKRNRITYDFVEHTEAGKGRICPYDSDRMPVGTAKEARMDYALCPMKYVLGYLVEKYPVYQSEFQQTYALNALISAVAHLMKDEGVTMDEVYKNVMPLFPNLRRIEKRQVYDYMRYDQGEEDMDYGKRSEYGNRFFTEERLKIHFPDRSVRSEAIEKYAKLMTPGGRKGMNLYEKPENEDICTFCPHINDCRNARYTKDQENYYE